MLIHKISLLCDLHVKTLQISETTFPRLAVRKTSTSLELFDFSLTHSSSTSFIDSLAELSTFYSFKNDLCLMCASCPSNILE